MSKTLPHKTILIFGVIFCFAVLIVVTGCSSNQKKRGIVFRGDWAFEINRTPWVGHPGNTDIPGEENGESSENKQGKSLCNKEKKSSLSDTLLGPLASLKSKCRCKDCVAAGGGNINITSYNPTIANTFPNPVPGAYPGAIPQGSLSLPPGAIVVPAGVLMPNGTLLPHHLFYSQFNTVNMTGSPGVNPATGQSIQQLQQPLQQPQPLQQGQATMVPGGTSATTTPTDPIMPPSEQGVPAEQYPAGTATQQGIPVQPPQMQSPQPQTPTLAPPQPSTQNGMILSQGTVPGPVLQGQYGVTPQGTPQTLTPETYSVMAQNGMTQHALMQSPSAPNPMLINPASAQVVPGMSMTGTQSPGYPPIGYAPSGYSPGYAQQISAPPLAGPLGPVPAQQPSLAARGSSQGKTSGATAADEDDEEPAVPRHATAMPYPRHFPVPTRPVYQRNMGMAPGYAAVQPPVTSPSMTQNSAFQGITQAFQGMMPQKQISQAAAQQEQQMMLERQRQALIMQQNAAVAQSASRQTGRVTPLQRPPVIAEGDDDEEHVAPLPPTSNILLANHQTAILQPPPPRVSQVTQTAATPTTKKSR